jgi:1-hydroxycarotenoid 3,4-desaturase
MLRRGVRTIVIGAGFGGLACAADMANAGVAVTVFDAAKVPGGKARGGSIGGTACDTGPTVVTMRWVFEELFADCGRSLSAEVPLERAEILARHAWTEGATLDLFADEARSADAVGAAFGARERRAFLTFRLETRRIYEAIEGPFLRSQP